MVDIVFSCGSVFWCNGFVFLGGTMNNVEIVDCENISVYDLGYPHKYEVKINNLKDKTFVFVSDEKLREYQEQVLKQTKEFVPYKLDEWCGKYNITKYNQLYLINEYCIYKHEFYTDRIAYTMRSVNNKIIFTFTELDYTIFKSGNV